MFRRNAAHKRSLSSIWFNVIPCIWLNLEFGIGNWGYFARFRFGPKKRRRRRRETQNYIYLFVQLRFNVHIIKRILFYLVVALSGGFFLFLSLILGQYSIGQWNKIKWFMNEARSITTTNSNDSSFVCALWRSNERDIRYKI